MKKLLKVLFCLFVSFLSSSFLIAQHGEPQYRRVGNLNANEVKSVFSNFGVIAQPGNEGPRFAWGFPYNVYAGDISILIGLELPIRDYRRGPLPPDGIPDTIPSVIITAVDRPGGGEGANGVSYTFEPLPGYFNPSYQGVGYGVAMSDDSQTWPDIWPDHPEYGAGVWNGLFGPDNFVGDQEALYVMDDFNDLENQLNNDFYPDSTNLSFTGHGIEVKVRCVVLNNPKYKDILFRIYDIKNKSLHNYHKLVFGNLIGSYVGGESPEWNDDVTLFYPKDNLIVVSDFDNLIDPAVNPNWEGPVGMFGETFIHTPNSNKIASYVNFVPSGDIVMRDDTVMFQKLTPGNYQWPSSVIYVDSIPHATRGEDSDCLWGGEYFSLNSDDVERFVVVNSFGYLKDEIWLKTKYAEALYHSNFDTVAVENSVSFTSPSYHKIISGNETITWNSINSNGTVEIWYSSEAGKNWVNVVKNTPNDGSYSWNTALFEDAAFGKLIILLKDNDGFIYALDESSLFTVNNSGNGSPYIEIQNPELNNHPTITEEEYHFYLLVGDPDNNSLLVNVLYSIGADTHYTFAQSFNVLSDTLIQTHPVNLSIMPNSPRLKIKFEVTDGSLFYSDVTPEFNKENIRIVLSNQNFEWIKKYSEVLIELRVIDSTLFQSEEYIISFNDITPNQPKKFSVYNTTSNQYTVLNEPFFPGSESAIFDGMTLYTEDILTKLDEFRSGWNEPNPQNLLFIMDQYVSANLSAYRYPFDYKLIFSDSYNDTSNYLINVFGPGAPPANPNINFKVYRAVDGNWERTQFAFSEPIINTFRRDTLSFGDVVIFSDPEGNDFSWRVTFSGDSFSLVPAGGDTLYLYTEKGISIYDSIRVYGLTVDVDDKPFAPADYSLSQNYPNPFNPVTRINYSIAKSGIVNLKVYDILGREIVTLVNEEKTAGKYEVNFNASRYASGVYFYRIQSGDFVQTKKMVLLK